MRDYRLFLQDILAAMDSIQEFVVGMTINEFINDDKTSSAVIRKLEIIGEAVKQIPPAIKEQYPSVPWKEMAGMRDVLIHFYFGVDLKLTWKTIQEDIPLARQQIAGILSDLTADAN